MTEIRNKINDGMQKQILIDGGYITFSGTTPQYHFYLQDHLGNNRVVVSAGGTVEQVNHYYPYGGLMGESTNGDVQRFKYNGKELDRMNGLDWLDYGARHMDGARVAWPTMDPLAEKYYDVSPYVYCVDNPIKLIDPTGKYITYTNNSNGITYVYYKGDFYHRTFRRINGNLVPKNSKVNVPLNSYMYRILHALRKMDESNNENIKEVFDLVSDINSEKEHNIRAGKKGKGSFTHLEGNGMTSISLNFEEDNNGSESYTDYEVVGHELKHAFDAQKGINSTETDKNGVEYDEYRAVQFENYIRKEEGRPLRTKYGRHPLPKEYQNEK